MPDHGRLFREETGNWGTKMICPLCDSDLLQLIYQAKSIPVFQNKVYPSQEAAKRAAAGLGAW